MLDYQIVLPGSMLNDSNYNLHAICENLKRTEKECEQPIKSLPPKTVQAAAANNASQPGAKAVA